MYALTSSLRPLVPPRPAWALSSMARMPPVWSVLDRAALPFFIAPPFLLSLLQETLGILLAAKPRRSMDHNCPAGQWITIVLL